jgi:uncharacterized RDD family membrane protein YckC
VAGSVPNMTASRSSAVFASDWLSGVRSRRIFAYLIDIIIIFLVQALGFLVAILLALPTFGLTTLAFGPLAATPLIGTIYSGLTVGGARQSTFGQRAMGLVMTRDDGEKTDFLYGAVHALLFYVSIVALTPFVLLVSLFDGRKRLLHDIVLSMVLRRSSL